MTKAYKIVVTGAFNSGKTTFVHTASDIPVVTTDRVITDALAAVKKTTTVALDYGQATVGKCLFHLFGTPGQERFDFMWDILGQDTSGLLVLVDSTDGSSLTLARILLRRLGRRRVTALVVATKQDLSPAMPPAEIAARLRLPAEAVVPCDPRRKASTRQVLQTLCATLQ